MGYRCTLERLISKTPRWTVSGHRYDSGRNHRDTQDHFFALLLSDAYVVARCCCRSGKVALPVNWTAGALANAANRWFQRVRRTDDLSRLVSAATAASVTLSDQQFQAVRRLLEDKRTWATISRGTAQDLASEISTCLQQYGCSSNDADSTGVIVARGLLEFTVADLEPKMISNF